MADPRSKRISTLGSRITSLVSVALVLILVGMAAMTGVAGKKLTDEVRRNLGFVIKMERDCSQASVDALKQTLLADPAVSLLTFNSAADIMAQESEYLGDDIQSLLDANPYSSEFDVKVKPAYAVPDSINALVATYGKAPEVAELVTESAVIEDVDAALARAGTILLISAAVLLLICIALINNTVSLSIYSRRFVIHTMKLVGATAAFIRRPFLTAAALNGLIAGAVASLVLFALKLYISSLDPLIAEALPADLLAVLCVALTLLGMAICVLTATFATNRYLSASYDEMFLK
ncbi:MAG: permease-like cell division protein FtsX [Muribaculaceae bacterium]|nr:permease-like cell division protein FtsX [Muribaculaceae bacterium]